MASPSSFEGLSKSQIKQRLTEMRKQYELMQKKLEKSEKAAKAKSHVKKKIADYKLNQSRGGSPECTLKAPQQQDAELLQESPLPSTASRRDGQSTGRGKAGSGKKNIKRRSVSFHLTDRTKREQSAKSKEEASRSTTSDEAGIRTPCGAASNVDAVSNVGSPVGFVERTGHLFADEVTPGKQDSCISEKSPTERKELLVEAPALSRGDESSETTLVKTMTEHYVGTVKDGSPKLSHVSYDPSSQEAIASEKPSTEGLSPETNNRTPPEDTQFDLFADTPPKIPDTIEGPTGSEASHKSTSAVKDLLVSNVSEPYDKPRFQHDSRKVMDSNASLSMNTNQGLDSARDVVGSQTSIDCVLSSDIHSKMRQRNEFPATNSESSASRLLQRTVVESLEECTEQEKLEENSDEFFMNTSMEDPDVIPGTYSEDVKALPKSAHFEARKNQRRSDTALNRERMNRRSIDRPTASVNELEDEWELEDNSCAQELKPYGRHPEQQDQHETKIMETNVADDVLAKASEVVSKTCETNPDSKGTSKGRRKSQRSIDNLSMDDVSLKDFVLSQQTSQEGTHSWIDGLMYPAEYYVRKTRSMSKPSPGHHSAPVNNQEYPCKQSLSRSVERPFFSDPLHQGGANQSVTLVTEMSETQTPKETPECPEANSTTQPEPCISPIKAGKEPTSAGKMKVSRTSATSQKRRGRPPKSRRKVKSEGIQSTVEKNLEVVQCQTSGTKDNQSVNGLTEYKGIDRESTVKPHEESTFKETRNVEMVGAETEISKVDEKLASTQVSHNPLESQYTQLEVPSAIPMPRLFGSPDTQSRNGVQRIANTYTGGHNPLESQFTQMQIPSVFALTTVFGSPGDQSQTHGSLQLGSPSSPCQRTPGNEIGSPLEAKAISHQDRNSPICDVNQQELNDVRLQGHPEHQWESQAYLADMVPEAAVPNCPDPNFDPSSAHATSTILFQEDHDYEGTPIHQEPGCEVVSQLQDDIRKASQNSDISMMSMLSQETARVGPDRAKLNLEHLETLPEDRFKVLPDDPSKRRMRKGLPENMTGVPLVTTVVPSVTNDAPASRTVVPVDHTEIPSSLCSNVEQGSPFADAATGTPPEVADIPLVQSQCTDPMRYPSQDEEVEQRETLDGEISVRGTSVFQFRGCLEHTIKGTSSGIMSLRSSRVVISGTNRSATTVQYSSEIFIWLQDFGEGDHEFKLLSSWHPEKIDEEIHIVHPYSGAEGCFEAVVIIRDGTASESIRFIQLDIQQGTWQENTIWTSRDLLQQTCTALCVNPGRWFAFAAHHASSGSDVLYSHLDEVVQSEPDFLPALHDRLNSLTGVESSPDMIVGVTNVRVLLWHLPTGQLVQEFPLISHNVTNSIQATAESGLLFLVAYKKEVDRQHAKLSGDQLPSCCLLALNPATGRSSRLLSYTSPCMKSGTRILDVSVREGTLAACLSTGHILIWDLHSSELLTSSQSDSDHRASLVNLQDSGSMLLVSGNCVQMFERNI